MFCGQEWMQPRLLGMGAGGAHAGTLWFAHCPVCMRMPSRTVVKSSDPAGTERGWRGAVRSALDEQATSKQQ